MKKSYFNSKPAPTRKRRKATTDAPQPKRRKMDGRCTATDDNEVVAGGIEEVWSDGRHTARQAGCSKTATSLLVTGTDTR